MPLHDDTTKADTNATITDATVRNMPIYDDFFILFYEIDRLNIKTQSKHSVKSLIISDLLCSSPHAMKEP